MLKKSLIFIGSSFCLLCLVIVSLGYVITRDIDKDEVVLAEGEDWFDDWYTVTRIDELTFAIGEPRYWQRNYNYLLLGDERAILFDTGPGVQNIKPIVETLTQLPVTVISSHPHYDHIGNNNLFKQVAWLNVEPITREVEKGFFQPSFIRGFTTRIIPAFAITEWWQPNQQIDIGNRVLNVYSIPGHEAASVAIHEPERKPLFTGDFIYPGWLVAFAPTSNISDYLASARLLKEKINGDETLYGAHSVPEHPSPSLPTTALYDLEKTLVSINNGAITPEQRFPINIYRVNDYMNLYLPPF
jgi:hydroxyacylglutathione hydrolase